MRQPRHSGLAAFDRTAMLDPFIGTRMLAERWLRLQTQLTQCSGQERRTANTAGRAHRRRTWISPQYWSSYLLFYC